MAQENTATIYAYNDPNWVDSALKRCSRFQTQRFWTCAGCCNKDICTKLRQEEKERQCKENPEALSDLSKLKVEMCESWGSSNDITLEGEYGPELVIPSSAGGFYWLDDALPSITWSTSSDGMWRVVDDTSEYVTIEYVDYPNV